MTEETITPDGSKDKDPGTESLKDGEGDKNQAEALKRLTKEKEDFIKEKAEFIKAREVLQGKIDEEKEPTAEEKIVKAIRNENAKAKAVTDFFVKYPELAEFQEEVEKRLGDPSRAQVPTDEVIRGTIPSNAWMKIKAKLEKEAEEEETKSTMGGGDATGQKPKTEDEKLAERYNASLPVGFKPKTTS